MQNKIVFIFFLGSAITSANFYYKRRWILAKIILAFGFLGLIYLEQIRHWLDTLGTDSFSEAQNFNLKEAFFFIKTINSQAYVLIDYKFIGICITSSVIAVFFLILIKKLFKIKPELFVSINLSIGLLFVFSPLVYLGSSLFKSFNENTALFAKIHNNFDQVPFALVPINKNLKIIVYIGESTSVLNLSLYGYPRKTTPLLDKMYLNDKNFLLFENVFSTHTHTSPSLLEALSIGENSTENFFEIYDRKRIALTAILKSANIHNVLFSNQGESGTWNLASPIIFKQSSKAVFSTETRFLGKNEIDMGKPADYDFFLSQLALTLPNFQDNKNEVIFLHSYTGHGPYLSSIPEEFKLPIDNYLSNKEPNFIVGSNISPSIIKLIEEHDSAIRYIDFSVANIIKKTINLNQPVITIYFPDHGEAPYAGRGHDSARFIHEMARVPFIMYFNNVATKNYPKLFKKYSALSKSNHISTLAQLPYTIIDLLGIDIGELKGFAAQKNVMGEKYDNTPIITRHTNKGNTFVKLSGQVTKNNASNTFIDATDLATKIYVASLENNSSDTSICYGQSNTIGKALRATLVTNCLEFDLTPGNYMHLKSVSHIVNKKHLSFWINAEYINTLNDCITLNSNLDEISLNNKKTIIEFSSKTNFNDQRFLSCVQSIRDQGFLTAYQVPKKLAQDCSNYNNQNLDLLNQDCISLQIKLNEALSSNLFTDFIVDFSGIQGLEKLNVEHGLRWNVRNTKIDNIEKINRSKFRMVVIKTDEDPNTL